MRVCTSTGHHLLRNLMIIFTQKLYIYIYIDACTHSRVGFLLTFFSDSGEASISQLCKAVCCLNKVGVSIYLPLHKIMYMYMHVLFHCSDYLAEFKSVVCPFLCAYITDYCF